MMQWPEVSGKSVLDIGAYAGWFSFEAERRGAAKVTANDYYSWMVNYPLAWAWVVEQQQAGIEPDTYNAPYPIMDAEGQPGRALFDHTRAVLSSKVEPLFGPIDSTYVEPHHIVLLLGVLYHHENPVALMRRVYDLTKEMLVLETLSFEYPNSLAKPLWHFCGKGDLQRDNTTMWAPSSIAVRELLLKVGFKHVELLYGWDAAGYGEGQESLACRLWVHAYK